MRPLALCGLILAAVLAPAAHPAQAAPWCSTHGGMSCGYYTFNQCLEAIRGVGGSCVINPNEKPAARPAQERAAKPKREPEKKPVAAKPAPRDTAPPQAAPVAPVAVPQQPPPAAPVAEPPPSATPATHQAVKSFAEGRMLILSGKYEAGIAAMLALGHDDHPDVAVSIGYANQKLGRADEAKRWYEKALAADANHVAALANYGVLLVEQGNVDKARADLEKVKTLCGVGCREYKELAAAIARGR